MTKTLFRFLYGLIGVCFCLFIISCAQETFSTLRSAAEDVANLSAEAGIIQTVQKGTIVQLDGTDSIGDNIQFHWLFKATPANNQSLLFDFESRSPSFIADEVGTYVLQLHIVDDLGQIENDTVSIQVVSESLSDGNAAQYHEGINASCSSCHNGSTASGRPQSHMSASTECALCHATISWIPTINIDHAEVIGVCSHCHDDITAPAKNKNHLDTNEECNMCHNPGVTFKIYSTSSLARHFRTQSGSFRGSDFRRTGSRGNGFEFNSDRGTRIKSSDGDKDEDDDDRNGNRDEDEEGDDDVRSGGSDDHPNVNGRMCTECHTQSNSHFPTTDNCRACHTTSSWSRIITVDHNEVIGGCSDCHQKPAAHIATNAQCNTCHSTTNWMLTSGANSPFDHNTLPPNTPCLSCHNGSVETGKSASHILSSTMCNACHSVTQFVPVITVDHNHVLGACSSCHNGTIAKGISVTHILIVDECGLCHSTATFIISTAAPIAAFDHSTLRAGVICSSCHDGNGAIGKPSPHPITSSECDLCHTTTSFLLTQSAVPNTFNHSILAADAICRDCHNGTLAIGKPKKGHLITIRDCGACHAPGSWLKI